MTIRDAVLVLILVVTMTGRGQREINIFSSHHRWWSKAEEHFLKCRNLSRGIQTWLWNCTCWIERVRKATKYDSSEWILNWLSWCQFSGWLYNFLVTQKGIKYVILCLPLWKLMELQRCFVHKSKTDINSYWNKMLNIYRLSDLRFSPLLHNKEI